MLRFLALSMFYPGIFPIAMEVEAMFADAMLAPEEVSNQSDANKKAPRT